MLETYAETAAVVAWPGFAPLDVPLAIYDGSRTYLIRHPSPPDAFRRLRGFADVYGADTVLAELRANTEARIAGIWTATVGAAEGDWDIDRLGALLIHEAFHVYQTGAHPEWTANEVDLFTYPVRSSALLQLRRLETAALRRAITAPDSVRELCWAQAFLRHRGERFGRMPGEASAYERGSELREGLAQYIEASATRADPQLPGDGFAPDDVRERAYASGHAQAVLLDRLAPAWKNDLGAVGEDGLDGLDGLLRGAIGDMRTRRCDPSPDEVGRSRAVARADLERLIEGERAALASFNGAAGWRIEIVADEAPIWPEQFDPLNVRVLEGRNVLHERWVRVANEMLRMEVLGRSALTHGVGPHPVFDGIDRMSVTGLTEPEVTTAGDTTRVAGPGVTLEAIGAEVARDGQVVRLTLREPG